MTLNQRQKGCHRDKLIVESVDMLEVANTEQVAGLLFSDIKYGLVKCRERLRVLYNRKQIKRGRVDIAQPAYYFHKAPTLSRLQHLIVRTWGMIYLMSCYDNKFEFVQYEYALGNLQADAFVQVGKDFWFIEADRSNSRNPFRKYQLYNDLYTSGDYSREWWVDVAQGFPAVLIITDSQRKKEKIKKLEQVHNKSGLRFLVKTVDEIRVLFSANWV